MGEQDVMKMQQRRDFLIKFCYWAVIDISAYNILPGYVRYLDEQEQPRMGPFSVVWGIAAVVWIKGIYPKAERLIDIILKKTGWVLTGILLVFMAFNILASVLALVRYDMRADGKAAVYRWEQAVDEHFDDVKMERIYPNAIRQ